MMVGCKKKFYFKNSGWVADREREEAIGEVELCRGGESPGDEQSCEMSKC